VKPAFSVILFTVLSGAGLGALALAALADLTSPWIEQPVVSTQAMTTAWVIALALVIAGLGASTLHLANPRNAWRSLVRWRSSWLSREALAAVAFIPLALLHVALPAFAPGISSTALAAAIVLLAWTVLYCTAMIYASLKPIRQWHTMRVPVAFWLLAHASGALLVVCAIATERRVATGWIVLALALFVIALLAKLEYWRFIDGMRGRVSLERAIGVDKGVGPPGRERGAVRTVAARLLDVGHSKGTFLTHEFMHTPDATALRTVRTVALVAGFAIPLLWLSWGEGDWRVGAVAFIVCLIGLTAERWLFFAEARHTVRLYHGETTT
jgi:sulfite dehydrogenase (quinone) subunit SoeC